MYHTGPRYAEVVAFRGCPSSKAKRASEGGERDQEHDQSERSEHCENKDRQGEDKKRGRGYDNDEAKELGQRGSSLDEATTMKSISNSHSTNYFTSESVLSSRLFSFNSSRYLFVRFSERRRISVGRLSHFFYNLLI